MRPGRPWVLLTGPVDQAGNVLRDADAEILLSNVTRQADARRIVQRYRDGSWRAAQTVRFDLERLVHDEGIDAVITARAKSIGGIVRALRSSRDGVGEEVALSRLQDLGACRVVVDTPDELTVVAERISGSRSWRVRGKPMDFVRAPTPLGYRAVHLVVRRHGRSIEIQLRTRGQQQWAEAVEDANLRLDEGSLSPGASVVEGFGPRELRDYLRLASEVIHRREHAMELPASLLDRYRSARWVAVALGAFGA